MPNLGRKAIYDITNRLSGFETAAHPKDKIRAKFSKYSGSGETSQETILLARTNKSKNKDIWQELRVSGSTIEKN